MRILLDACVPRGLRKNLSGHEVRTAQEVGWGNLDNGELLDAMADKIECVPRIQRVRNARKLDGSRQD
ncbi:MAG: hypothetical protein ACREA0_13180, partial [bacterium]